MNINKQSAGTSSGKSPYFPPIGQRIIKTSLAVGLCLLISLLRGQTGSAISAEAPITAIICLQPYMRDLKKFALDRFTGTLIGALCALLFLGLFYAFPDFFTGSIFLYLMIALGTGVSLYASLLFRVPDTASLSAIVFLCIVISFPDIESPVTQILLRILDVFTGTAAAVLVNVLRLPVEKQDNKILFLRTKDLTADRFSPASRTVLYRLNRLQEEGAKICLESEHAPAFFLLQMSNVKLNLPMIVMDGAAIYDVNEGEYLHYNPLSKEALEKVTAFLDQKGISYFIYTIQNNHTCIFHRGDMRDEERDIYTIMKRSPYRNYLEGDDYDNSRVVYIKVVATQENIRILGEDLSSSEVFTSGTGSSDLRLVLRDQHGSSSVQGLYIYSALSTREQAEAYVMKQLKKEDSHFEAVHIYAEETLPSERDSLRILRKAEKTYMPVKLFVNQ